MKLAGRMGNATMYEETMKSAKQFCRFKKIKFQDITNTFLNKYEAWLRSRGGTDGGISIKQRTLRALYNKAIERNIIKDINHPFKTYKISKLKGQGIKKALDFDQVTKIINFDLSKHPHLIDARNYFVFSFYTRGMNYTDMMVLKWQDIDGTTISYIRPTPAQIDHRKKKTLAKYNRDLKEIANLCGINKSLSSYVARHSFANCLKQKGVATDIIGESLGHKDLTTTQVYLKELGSTVLDDAAALLL